MKLNLIPNFLDQPIELRSAALRQKFYLNDEHPNSKYINDFWRSNWSGIRTKELQHVLPDSIRNELEIGIMESMNIDYDSIQGYEACLYFQFNSVIDVQDTVILEQLSREFDQVAILPLTPETRGSIEFFDADSTNKDFDFKRPLKNDSLFSKDTEVSLTYNDLVYFDSTEFIKWHNKFGKEVDTGELYLVLMLRLIE